MSSIVDLAAIYREALDHEPWDNAEAPENGQTVRVGQFDEVVAEAAHALGSALDAGDLARARRSLRGLRAVSEAFGSASWAI